MQLAMILEERSYRWFEQRRKNQSLELAHDQITKAFETVTWLHKATQSFSEKNFEVMQTNINNLYATEEGVDTLRTAVFTELSRGAALVADYREDLLHLVKRLDTLADDTKDAARCLEMLSGAEIPQELSEKTVFMTRKLVEIAQALRNSIEKISSNPREAVAEAKGVGEIEHTIDVVYLKIKSLFVKYGSSLSCGTLVIFDDFVEFIEKAADTCADTADYIAILSSTE
jgi:predicted phosphate transport protein (TIGR00153 family)